MYERRLFYRQIQTPVHTAFPTYDAATNAWITQVIANGGTVSNGRKATVNDLIVALKADGIWTKLDRLWLFAAENQESALTDLKGLVLATAVNSPTFTTDRGYTAASSGTKYVDSNFSPSTHGVNFTLNSAHHSTWIRTTRSSATQIASGGRNGSNSVYVELFFNGADTLFAINATDLTTSGNGTAAGHFHGNRSDANNVQGYRNGSSVGSDAAFPSLSLISEELYVGCSDFGGSPSFFTSDEYAAYSLGGSLNSTEAGNLYTRLQTYMTAVGA